MVSVLLQTYATNEIVEKAHNDAVSFPQSFAETKDTYFQVLCDKPLRFKTMYSGRPWKSIIIDGVLPKALPKTDRFIFINLRVDYHTVARQAQALNSGVPVTRQPATTAPAVGKTKKQDSVAELKRC